MTFYFTLSKIFSSITTVIVARYLGATNFGEAQIILLLAQWISLLMLSGMHIVAIRYSAGKSDPNPALTASIGLASIATVATAGLVWFCREPLIEWFDLSALKVGWTIAIGILFSAYLLYTSIYQALHYFKQRGQIEVFFAFMMLPGLAVGHLLMKGDYQVLLVAYAIAYAVSCLPMIWRFRHLLRPWAFVTPETREMISYGALSCISNVGYVLTFIVQPIQLQQYQDTEQVGIFRLYCYGSINMAAFATSIISTVLFPKMSASNDKLGVWRILDKIWLRAGVPMFCVFVIIGAIVVWLAGDDYPLNWTHILLFALASSLLTVQSTYAQIMASQGVRGMRWGLLLSILSGLINVGLSAILIPRLGATGAVAVLIINYGITLVGTFMVRDVVLKTEVK